MTSLGWRKSNFPIPGTIQYTHTYIYICLFSKAYVGQIIIIKKIKITETLFKYIYNTLFQTQAPKTNLHAIHTQIRTSAPPLRGETARERNLRSEVTAHLNQDNMVAKQKGPTTSRAQQLPYSTHTTKQ